MRSYRNCFPSQSKHKFLPLDNAVCCLLPFSCSSNPFSVLFCLDTFSTIDHDDDYNDDDDILSLSSKQGILWTVESLQTKKKKLWLNRFASAFCAINSTNDRPNIDLRSTAFDCISLLITFWFGCKSIKLQLIDWIFIKRNALIHWSLFVFWTATNFNHSNQVAFWSFVVCHVLWFVPPMNLN